MLKQDKQDKVLDCPKIVHKSPLRVPNKPGNSRSNVIGPNTPNIVIAYRRMRFIYVLVQSAYIICHDKIQQGI